MEQACNEMVNTSFYDHGNGTTLSPYTSTKTVFLSFEGKELMVHGAVLRPMQDLPDRTRRKGQSPASPNDTILFPFFRYQVGHALVDYLYRGTYHMPRPDRISIADPEFWGSVLRLSLELYALSKMYKLEELSIIAAGKATESSTHLGAEEALHVVETCDPLPAADDVWFRKTITDFLIAAYGDMQSLVKRKMSGPNDLHTQKKIFSCLHLFMDIMVELEEKAVQPPGTADTKDFQTIVVKPEPGLPGNEIYSWENILFLARYQKWSPEELRLADYAKSRRYRGDDLGGSSVHTFDPPGQFGSRPMMDAGFGTCSSKASS